MQTSLSKEFLYARHITKIFNSLKRFIVKAIIGVITKDIKVKAKEVICLMPPGILVLTSRLA
jgi:hypothetical protein